MSQQLRERGNALYKRGQLTDAIKAYQQAARQAAPDDYLPWSNLSAAYYEGGNLAESIQSALRALAICQRHDQANGSNTSAAAEQKLVPRLIRAYLHAHDFDAARQWLDRLGAGAQSPLSIDEIRLYRETLVHAETLWRAVPNIDMYRLKLLTELPRFRPSFGRQQALQNSSLDEVTNLVDFAVHSDIERNLSVFLGGVGDARHFYAQLAILGVTERMSIQSASFSKRKYHFTLNDNNNAAVGRNLVLSVLLDDLACVADLPQVERTEIYTLVYYMFAGVIIPRYALARLFRTVDLVIGRLRNNEPVLPWLQIYDTDCSKVISALELWQDCNIINACPTSDVIDKTVQGLKDVTMSYKNFYGSDDYSRTPSGCRKEFETYFEAPFLQAPRSVMREHEPELLQLLETDAPGEKLSSYITEHWCVNPTLIDGEGWHLRETSVFGVAVSENPFDVCRTLYNAVSIQERGGPRKTKLFDYASGFFQMVVVAIRRIRGRLSAEYLLNDLAEVIEEVRYGLVEDRDTAAPAVFDLVHLSNAAGCVGSSDFSRIIHAGKVLNGSQDARLVISTRRLDSRKDFHEESHSRCMTTSDGETLFKTSQLRVTGKKGQSGSTSSSLILELKRVRPAAFPYEHLLSRAELTRFVITQFFRLAAPCGRSFLAGNNSDRETSASNLANFFDILIHLHDVGYPAHWLADVLAKILGDGVNASPSPPRTPDESNPRRNNTASMAALEDVYGSSAAPFIPELSTLTTMFQRVLPFSPIATGLPSPASICQYSINFNKALPLPMVDGRRLLLMIYNIPDYVPTAASMNFPFPDEGCILISTFTYTHDSDDNASVKFWMREDLMSQIQTQTVSSDGTCRWYSTVLRADFENKWIPCSEQPAQIDDTVVKGEQWISVYSLSTDDDDDDENCNNETMELDD
ncbi:hypothetical protein UA08_05130 [Talaromyces atroroseus]|uniref:DUF4470 domain-containing protein n=1 Tax=Talaromyces atroroseus TaxID=1441469 RepID=A0A225AEF6_TALAT|nr:hypothetical protein UA08_05130 [Talaromyces atroroseus]OKL59652.1 hypothetical protein UA08_05130 [Talaromyces atroroseus]